MARRSAPRKLDPSAAPNLTDRVNWGGAPTGKFLICPATEHLHEEPVAIEIYLTSRQKRPTACCSCGTRVWLGPTIQWQALPDVETVQVQGIRFAQRAPLEVAAWPDAPQPRYLVCPVSGVTHPAPLALPVQRGEKAFHAKCRQCFTQVFPGKRWTHSHGFPRQVMDDRGVDISG